MWNPPERDGGAEAPAQPTENVPDIKGHPKRD